MGYNFRKDLRIYELSIGNYVQDPLDRNSYDKFEAHSYRCHQFRMLHLQVSYRPFSKIEKESSTTELGRYQKIKVINVSHRPYRASINAQHVVKICMTFFICFAVRSTQLHSVLWIFGPTLISWSSHPCRRT